MTLSRHDTMYFNIENWHQYAQGTSGDKDRDAGFADKRAYWHPGVGLWQIDFYGPAVDLNHAERANTEKGGKAVAVDIADKFCGNLNENRA